jgi:uncharacterized membrane protein YkoI
VDENLTLPSSKSRSVIRMNTPKIPRKVALAAGAVLALAVVAGGGTAYALSNGDDDDTQRPIPAGDREQAEEAALEETGGGRVTETEVDDEESKYEVEVTLDDGTQVDVQLDEDFNVVSSENDGHEDESDDDSDGSDDD